MYKEFIDNADWTGTEIIPEKGDFLQKTLGVAKYTGTQLAPFGATGLFTGKSPITKLGGFIGLRPVPRFLTNTSAMNAIDEALRKQSPRSRTEEQTEKSRLVADLKEMGWSGDREGMEAGIREGRKSGQLTPIQIEHIRHAILEDKRVAQFKKLRQIEDVMDVYEKGTPDERKLWKRQLMDKWSRVSPEKRRGLMDLFKELMKLPVADEMPERVPPRFSILNQ